MKNKHMLLCWFFLLLSTSTFYSCLTRPLNDGDFLFPGQKEGPLVPKTMTSTQLATDLNDFCIYHKSPLRACFDGPSCNLYRLDYLREGKKDSPLTLSGSTPLEDICFTEALKRICETYGLDSDRRGNVFHLKKKKSRILLEEEYKKASN
jgi:hypothetical protein